MERERNREFPTPQLLRIDGIAGIHYRTDASPKGLLIYGIGAPNVPDSGHLPDAPIVLNHGLDLFVPDYIGFGRSDGIFTPENCIKTFTQLYDNFSKGCVGRNTYDNLHEEMQYDRILVVGRSLGGTYVPLLPRFNDRIKEIAIFSAVVDSKSQGSVEGEETNKLFLDSMREDGYHHLYRGILEENWVRHLENEDDLSPMDNIQYLSDVKLFIGHGRKDPICHYSKLQRYYNQIIEKFPERKENYKMQIYETGDHGKSTTNLAMTNFLDWLNLKR